jgi:AcrR family transcriptional regulator
MDPKQPWMDHGYRTFAYEGPTGLKVERLARQVGKSKSSFYHLFADLSLFNSDLLDYHLERAALMAERESQSETEDELIGVIMDHKIDLLFNRQLRFHRENPDFAKCFTAVNQLSVPALLPLWKQIIDLREQSYLAELVLLLTLDNFFLQITDQTLHEEWLKGYMRNIRQMVRQFKQTGNLPQMDGSV